MSWDRRRVQVSEQGKLRIQPLNGIGMPVGDPINVDGKVSIEIWEPHKPPTLEDLTTGQ